MFASIPISKIKQSQGLFRKAGHNHLKKNALETRFSLRVAGAFSHGAHAVRQWHQKGEPPLQYIFRSMSRPRRLVGRASSGVRASATGLMNLTRPRESVTPNRKA
jgi:hypothetical protein